MKQLFLPTFLMIFFVNTMMSQETDTIQSTIEVVEESYQDFDFAPEESIVNLPISIEIKAIEEAVNGALEGLVYEDNSFDNNNKDNLKVKAWRKEDIKIGLRDSVLTYYVPLKLWIQYQYSVLGMTSTKTVEGAIAFNFETKYSLEENWNFDTQTDLKSYKWLETPTIDLGITKLSIKFVANQLLDANKDLLTKTIDDEIKRNLELKSYAGDAWKMLQEPILMDSVYQLWLKLTPKEILMTPLYSSRGVIKSTLGIKSLTECTIGEKPKFRENTALPNFIEKESIPDDFTINISTDIPYEEAERVASMELVGETFTEGKHSVTITGMDIYGRDDLMIIDTQMEGKLTGNIYLSAKPIYNPVTQAIEMENFDYDLKTKNFLHKSANWLLHSTIVKKMEPYMNYPLANDLKEVRKMVEASLDNYEPVKGIIINGELRKMEIEGIYLTPDGIRVSIIADGDLDMKVEGLSY